MLLGAYPVLFLFAQNLADQVTLQPLWGPLFVCMAGAAGLLVLFYALRRDWARAGLMASVVLAVVFSFGHVWNLLSGVLDQRWLLAAIWLVWGVGLAQVAWRGGPWVPRVTLILNIAVFALVLYNVVTIGGYVAATRLFPTSTGEVLDL
ncbi:MAG TPA: hypothetical protein VF468_03680, partial [Actinomycetota bacterium]|nr:hypothetical protein [Actinomycetota bacterium]